MEVTGSEIANWLQKLQDDICISLQNTDGKSIFGEDNWQRPAGGGGRSRVIQNGAVFEKGGVMFSAVKGEAPDFLLKENAHSFAGLKTDRPHFFATGISIVIHPQSPMVPIIHMNIRYFELRNGNDELLKRWLGGGIDLTPHYIDKNDARFFHRELKSLCDAHHPAYYGKFKKWADDYFYISHRGETRGIGGIFFDKLAETPDRSFEENYRFWQDVGKNFVPLYSELVERSKTKPFNDNHRQWQLLRRGRYVEFNLIYDKGTRFGLESNGRIESILVSLPRTAGWEYNFIPGENSEEAKTLQLLKKDIDWLEA